MKEDIRRLTESVEENFLKNESENQFIFQITL